MPEAVSILESFDGIARLFPLPNLVLFPGVDQGLRIFEHRYRQLAADALASDLLIAPVLLRPDWEEAYDGTPAIETVACLGRITHSERRYDGRYDLVVRGVARYAIAEEIPDDDKLYRIASGSILPSVSPNDSGRLSALRLSLRESVLARFEPNGPAAVYLEEIFDGEDSLGEVCDQLGYGLPLAPLVKQSLLAETDVAVRMELLIAALRPPPPTSRPFPPRFSAN